VSLDRRSFDAPRPPANWTLEPVSRTPPPRVIRGGNQPTPR
jgi:hypothetical protein